MPASKQDIDYIREYFPNKIPFFYIKLTIQCNLNCSIWNRKGSSRYY